MALDVAGGRGRALAGVGAALLALGLAAIGYGLAGGEGGRSVGPVSAVNTDRPGISAHNSPAVAVWPAAAGAVGRLGTVVVADRIDTPAFSCSVHLSTNSGRTWRTLALPLPPAAPNCFWPDVAFDPSGRLLVLYTATGGRYNQPVGVWVQRFEGTVADGPAVRVAPSEAFHAHFEVVGDALVAAWVQGRSANADQPLGLLPAPNPIMVSRSTDAGLTWTAPVTVSEPDRLVVHPVVVGGPDGSVVVGALDLVDDRENYEALHGGQGGPPPDGAWEVVVWRSTDGGASFGPAVSVAGGLVIAERVVVDLMGGAALAAGRPAADRTSDQTVLVAAWEGGRGDERDVSVARSVDGGLTWEAPVQLGRAGEQFLPAVSVAPDGRIDVLFYERRPEGAGSEVDVVVASSSDDGATFDAMVVSNKPFDAAIGLASAQGLPQRGNQLALVSADDGLLAFWGDATGGTVDDNVQDLATVRVTLDASGRRPGAAVAGAILAVGGLGLGLAGLSAGARRRRPAPALR